MDGDNDREHLKVSQAAYLCHSSDSRISLSVHGASLSTPTRTVPKWAPRKSISPDSFILPLRSNCDAQHGFYSGIRGLDELALSTSNDALEGRVYRYPP